MGFEIKYIYYRDTPRKISLPVYIDGARFKAPNSSENEIIYRQYKIVHRVSK